MRALPLVLVLLAAPDASCGAAPSVRISIGTETVPMALSSSTKTLLNRTEHGDAFPQRIPLTTIRTSTPVSLRFEAGQGATEIRGVIYDLEAPWPSGGPIDEFAIPGRVGTHEARTVAFGRSYEILVNVKWSVLVTHGEETHVFRLRIEPQ